MRNLATVFGVVAYFLLGYISISAPFYARAHPRMDQAMAIEYSSAWPVALGCSVAIAGIMLTSIPIRKGEKWAMLTSFVMLLVLVVNRIATDPRCWVVLDVHQHGCHTFMIAVALGVAAVFLAGIDQNRNHGISAR